MNLVLYKNHRAYIMRHNCTFESILLMLKLRLWSTIDEFLICVLKQFNKFLFQII